MTGVVCPWCKHEFPWSYMRSDFVKFRLETWDNLCYCTQCHGKFIAAPDPEIVGSIIETWGPVIGEDDNGYALTAISEYDDPKMLEQDFEDNRKLYMNSKVFGKKFDASALLSQTPSQDFDASSLFSGNTFDSSVLGV